jgi:hypothetical protein
MTAEFYVARMEFCRILSKREHYPNLSLFVINQYHIGTQLYKTIGDCFARLCAKPALFQSAIFMAAKIERLILRIHSA